MQTVLLIESDPATLVTLSMILRCFGHEVLEARSRGDAWSVCCAHQGPIHLMLTKAVLDGSSSEFMTRLRLLHPQIRALFVSHASSAALADRQGMPCEYALLSEPFRADALADTIRVLLNDPKTIAVSSSSS